ncbi:MAG: acyl carrier protein [Chthonomonadales bacterium]
MEGHARARAYVLGFFSERGTIPGDTEEERMACDYIYANLVDSMGMVELITGAEEELGVELTQEDFEDPRFKTVGGLIHVLASKMEPGVPSGLTANE